MLIGDVDGAEDELVVVVSVGWNSNRVPGACQGGHVTFACSQVHTIFQALNFCLNLSIAALGF